jgi:hypothetical protein
MAAMNGIDEIGGSQASILCRSCGLCCTGHLFIWARLRPSELDPAEELGMHVFRSDPTQRGFSQPCPLWQGECTVYDSPHYPRVCRAYHCKLLKELVAETVSLSGALAAVEQARGMIRDLETHLPASSQPNFRERLVAQLETLQRQKTTGLEFQRKAAALLRYYKQVFGVTDVVDRPPEE